jgi:hypothetical protein
MYDMDFVIFRKAKSLWKLQLFIQSMFLAQVMLVDLQRFVHTSIEKRPLIILACKNPFVFAPLQNTPKPFNPVSQDPY